MIVYPALGLVRTLVLAVETIAQSLGTVTSKELKLEFPGVRL